jgi:eukaryotic-like serine/threonine-protein kinase
MAHVADKLNTALADRYRIERELGAGGMATVYLAQDLKHDRKVAIKVLKPELAAVLGAERFVQEIKTTAALQHPHILPLFDSGEAGGFLYYVMPYIEGETIREKLNRETQFGIGEAVKITTEVADALDYAHRNGVIHRDIKPENLLLHDGRAMVMDFGIALAVSAAAGGRMTETGLSLGTPHYMSPEQATADKQITARSDVYSLASVLYEMLTGNPPHVGASAQQIIMKIVTEEAAPVTSHRKAVPPHVAAAVATSLEKLPADRFATAAEFGAALENPAFTTAAGTATATAVPPYRRTALVPALAAVAIVAAALAAWGWLRQLPEPVRNVQRFADPFADGEVPVFIGSAGFGLSGNGAVLAYRHVVDNRQIIVVRRWDALRSEPVRETLDALLPAPSPDGSELAFSQDGKIRALALAGGPVRTLMAGGRPVWGPDGYVYAADDSVVLRVPAGGGTVDTLARATGGETYDVHDVLPDGRHALVVREEPSSREIQLLDLASGIMRPLVPGDYPRYVPSGHLVFATADDDLMAVRLDPGTGALLGTAVPVIQGVSYFTVADDGTLFYSRSSGADANTAQVVWLTPSGTATPVDPDWQVAANTTFLRFDLRLSPDGRRLAVRDESSFGSDIWIKRLDRGPRERLTFDPADDWGPEWRPPAGREISFISDRGGNADVWIRSADGTGDARLLLDLEEPIFGAVWSPDGRWLVAEVRAEVREGLRAAVSGGGDLVAFRPDRDSVAASLLATPASEGNPAISPDGRWLAYVSDETGTRQVYVRPFPDVRSGRWQVSTDGGRGPRWAPDGRRLYFTGPLGAFMAADVEAGGGAGSFRYGSPRMLFDLSRRDWEVGRFSGLYVDIAPSGDRFIAARRATEDSETGPGTILVNNFFRLLEDVVR